MRNRDGVDGKGCLHSETLGNIFRIVFAGLVEAFGVLAGSASYHREW